MSHLRTLQSWLRKPSKLLAMLCHLTTHVICTSEAKVYLLLGQERLPQGSRIVIALPTKNPNTLVEAASGSGVGYAKHHLTLPASES